MNPATQDPVSWALSELVRDNEESVGRAARILIYADHADVEPALLRIFDNNELDYRLSGIVSRILVERDPGRDPKFLLDRFTAVEPASGRLPLVGRLVSRFAEGVPPAAMLYTFGFPRLRMVCPIDTYAGLLNHKYSGIRVIAAAALGDTANLESLSPLAVALADSKSSVRVQAADSVRRLRHAGAGTVLAEHPVRDELIDCLHDRRRKVRIAAARALGSLGDFDPLHQRQRRSLRDRREIRRIIRGEIPDLPKIWPGDSTV